MKYAIFDLDGTLVDSMQYWRGFAKAFLREKGIEPSEEIERIAKTDWVRGLCDYFLQKYNIQITPPELHDWAIAYVVKQYTHTVPFKANSKQMLDKLYSEGVKMCICSSTDRSMMEPVLKRLDMNKYFQFTEHCRQYGKEKNEPDIFIDCMKRLGADDPSQVAVFEDALYSAATAKKCGFYVVGIYDATEHQQTQLKDIADQYITDYNQLDYSLLPQ